MNPQLIADLEAAKNLISTPEKWHQGELRKYGEDEKPCKWCALGACYQLTERSDYMRYRDMARALKDVVGMPVHDWNDAPERTHGEVLAAFDRAIANERNAMSDEKQEEAMIRETARLMDRNRIKMRDDPRCAARMADNAGVFLSDLQHFEMLARPNVPIDEDAVLAEVLSIQDAVGPKDTLMALRPAIARLLNAINEMEKP